jgi:hypothetical protein
MKEDVMNRLEKVLYTAKAHSAGGRSGVSRSSDGRLEVRLSRPGSPGTGTNPEQLFAAGVFSGSKRPVAWPNGLRHERLMDAAERARR